VLAGGDRPDRDIGTVLVQHDYLARGELQAILRSVVVDALIALTAPADEDAFVSRIGFASSVTHWARAFLTLDAGSLQTEAASLCTPCPPKPSPRCRVVPTRPGSRNPSGPAVASTSTDLLRRVLNGLRRST
jgi:hypothetical protein